MFTCKIANCMPYRTGIAQISGVAYLAVGDNVEVLPRNSNISDLPII